MSQNKEHTDTNNCFNCKHYLFFSKCDAFNEIPLDIIRGENDHSEPLPNQDNDITFEQISND